jgi:hypothetical protein
MAEIIEFPSQDRCILHGNMLLILLIMVTFLTCFVSLHMSSKPFFLSSNIVQSLPAILMFLRHLWKCSLQLHYIAWDGMVILHLFKILHGQQGAQKALLNYTDCCFDAIESLQEIFVCRLTPEKEREKQWTDQKLGFKGAWRDGWLMYDGTIVVLYRHVQVWSTTWFSNFCISFLSFLPRKTLKFLGFSSSVIT